MTSEDLNERVNHPSWYTKHPSGIECIELIEHLPANLANAVKYLWRCGLKTTETPLRELMSAKWYTDREIRRIELFELDDEPTPKTAVVWRALARQVVDVEPESTLSCYLDALLINDLDTMRTTIEIAIEEIEVGS